MYTLTRMTHLIYAHYDLDTPSSYSKIVTSSHGSESLSETENPYIEESRLAAQARWEARGREEDVQDRVSAEAILAQLDTTGGARGSTDETPRTLSYQIQPGDTLSAIARKLGTNMSALMKMNNIIDPDKIIAGRELKYTPEHTV
jgi:LysM repeat protein